jgi:hypothetical protein
MLVSGHRLGLAIGRLGPGLADAAGGVQGAGNLGVGQAGLAGGGSQRAQVSSRVGLQGAVGGPVQAGVAVALPLGGDPAGQVAQSPVWGRAGFRPPMRPVGLQQTGDGGPVEVAVAAGDREELVAMAVDLGGRGQASFANPAGCLPSAMR